MPGCQGRGSICLAANDLAHLVRNGGVGTYFWSVARLLAADGWRVHVLFVGEVEDGTAIAGVRARLAEAGVGLSLLGDFPPPPHADLTQYGTNELLRRSDHARHALETLHARHRFDLIEFAEWQATGFRAVQARRTGAGLGDVRLLVKLHGSSRWNREGNLRWPADPGQLLTDYAERYSFENADFQLAPSRYMLDYARSASWHVHGDARVVANPFPERAEAPPDWDGTVDELVFFGRLETRKGLELFVDAVRGLDPGLKVTFLGKDTDRPDGERASALARRSLPGRAVTVLSDRNQEEALAYLRGRGRLAVMPSLADNLPYTVIECAARGIPFLATDVGGIPEILPEGLRRPLLGAPRPDALAGALRAYLGLSAAERLELRRRVLEATDPDRSNRRLVDEYRRLLEAGSQGEPGASATGVLALRSLTLPARPRPADPEPPVSVVVTHYNLGPFLPEALASLAVQTWKNLDVVVVDDGSTCAASCRVLEEQEARHPSFRFVRQANAGVGAARNRGLGEARGEFVVFFDADNVALPHMVEALAEGLRRNPDLAGLTCYVRGFRDLPDGERRFEWVTCFTGGPHALAVLRNVYGDTNAILRAAALRSVGGYSNDRRSPWEDLMTYARLVQAGHRLDVLPEYLFDYRVRDEGRLATLDGACRARYANTLGLLRQCLLRPAALPEVELEALWVALLGFAERAAAPPPEDNGLTTQLARRLAKVLDRLRRPLKRVPLVHGALRRLVGLGLRTADRLKRAA